MGDPDALIAALAQAVADAEAARRRLAMDTKRLLALMAELHGLEQRLRQPQPSKAPRSITDDARRPLF